MVISYFTFADLLADLYDQLLPSFRSSQFNVGLDETFDFDGRTYTTFDRPPLLLAAGVETVPDLARRNGANLTLKLADVNESEKICEELPSEEMVADWVAQAKELPKMITY